MLRSPQMSGRHLWELNQIWLSSFLAWKIVIKKKARTLMAAKKATRVQECDEVVGPEPVRQSDVRRDGFQSGQAQAAQIPKETWVCCGRGAFVTTAVCAGCRVDFRARMRVTQHLR